MPCTRELRFPHRGAFPQAKRRHAAHPSGLSRGSAAWAEQRLRQHQEVLGNFIGRSATHVVCHACRSPSCPRGLKASLERGPALV